MLVIHAGFRERCLVLWGELSISDCVPAEPGVHPFSASYEQLADTLESISVKVPRVEAVSDEVLLPSFDKMPVPSSPLLGREAQGKKAAALRPGRWKRSPSGPRRHWSFSALLREEKCFSPA
jgi:hypothetical protein